MSDQEYDDTDMTPEEFEKRMASAIPAEGFARGVFVEPSTNCGSTTSSTFVVHVGVRLAQVATPSHRPA